MDNIAFTKIVNRLVDQKLKINAKEIEAIMKREVPVDTGTLRASITNARSGQNEYKIGYTPEFLKAKNNGIDYAPFVYWGSVKKKDLQTIG